MEYRTTKKLTQMFGYKRKKFYLHANEQMKICPVSGWSGGTKTCWVFLDSNKAHTHKYKVGNYFNLLPEEQILEPGDIALKFTEGEKWGFLDIYVNSADLDKVKQWLEI